MIYRFHDAAKGVYQLRDSTCDWPIRAIDMPAAAYWDAYSQPPAGVWARLQAVGVLPRVIGGEA